MKRCFFILIIIENWKQNVVYNYLNPISKDTIDKLEPKSVDTPLE